MHTKIQRSFGYLIVCTITMMYVPITDHGFDLEQCLKDVLLNHPKYGEPNHCNYKCNEDVKFARFPTEHDKECTIILIGGQDVPKMSLRFPKCMLHVYEPINNLVSFSNRYKNVKVYPFGLEDRKESRTHGTSHLKVVDVLDEIKKYKRIDLLDVNCSGCEWRLMPRLYGMFDRFMHVQFSIHSSGNGESWWYCQIRKELSTTHHMTGGVSTAFMWERWSRFKT